MIAAILALLGAVLAAIGAAVFHRRAVITAEQRGRLDQIEEERRVARERLRAMDAVVDTLQADGERSADAARESVPRGTVMRADVDRWIKPPGEKPS